MMDKLYWTVERPARTTQRYQLDLDRSGRYLASGEFKRKLLNMFLVFCS